MVGIVFFGGMVLIRLYGSKLSIADMPSSTVCTTAVSPIVELIIKWKKCRAGHSMSKYCLMNCARSRSTVSASLIAFSEVFPSSGDLVARHEGLAAQPDRPLEGVQRCQVVRAPEFRTRCLARPGALSGTCALP
jgi:hypothetical protein